ncbi:MAG: hypothetical protein NTY17_08085 [Planctomycetia bacterium]|nr:hypothetical protein [Planctomycetia bacterium]
MQAKPTGAMGLCVLAVFATAAVADDRSDLVRGYLLAEVDAAAAVHQREWKGLASPADVAARRQRLERAFLTAIGSLPERAPLTPRVTGRVVKPGYSVEKIILASQPGIHVTAALFLPDERTFLKPWPAVLVACGHADVGKAFDGYQRAAALLATHGIAALLFDPIGQGERRQFVDPAGKSTCGGCVGEHNAVGAATIPLGRNLASWMIWDGIRSLDYLASRPDIRADRLGCMGNSGGGTQTAYIMALDDRVTAAAVSCYITSLFGRLPRTIGPQDAEQNIFGQLTFGMDHADYLLMRAAKPTLVCAATRDFFDIGDTRQSVADARRIFWLCGGADRLAIAEADAEHGFSQPLREAACRFMLRWLADRDEPVTEPAKLEVLAAAEIACTPTGSVLDLPGARTFSDLAAAESRRLAAARLARGPLDAATLRSRALARSGMRPPHEPAPAARVTVAEVDTLPGMRIDHLTIETEPGIELPADLWTPPAYEEDERPGVLFVSAAGRGPHDDAIRGMVAAGRRVLAVDLRGTGETAPGPQNYFDVRRHGVNGQDAYLAYLLGRSLVGMQADDIVACGRWLAASRQPTRPADASVELIAAGLAVIPAVHAAAIHPELFPRVGLEDVPRSWSSHVEGGPFVPEPLPLASLIHGVLHDYDLPDLINLVPQPANDR